MTAHAVRVWTGDQGCGFSTSDSRHICGARPVYEVRSAGAPDLGWAWKVCAAHIPEVRNLPWADGVRLADVVAVPRADLLLVLDGFGTDLANREQLAACGRLDVLLGRPTWEAEAVEEAANHEPDHSCCDPEDRPMPTPDHGQEPPA